MLCYPILGIENEHKSIHFIVNEPRKVACPIALRVQMAATPLVFTISLIRIGDAQESIQVIITVDQRITISVGDGTKPPLPIRRNGDQRVSILCH